MGGAKLAKVVLLAISGLGVIADLIYTITSESLRDKQIDEAIDKKFDERFPDEDGEEF